MIRRLATVLVLAALAGCEAAPTSGERGGITVSNQIVPPGARPSGPVTKLPFGLGESQDQAEFGQGRARDDTRMSRPTDPTEELLIIERRKLGYPSQVRGAEMWATTPARTIPLPLKHTDVKAKISIYIGSVTVTQQYHNPYDSKIE